MTFPKAPSKNTLPADEAEKIRQMIYALGDYAHVTVRAERSYLNVYNVYNVYQDDENPLARLTPLGGDQYGLSFRNSTGRWEAMSFTGDLDRLITALGPYLEGRKFPDRNSQLDPRSTGTHGRRVTVEGMYNLRDLGGLPTASGRATRWGRLFRSEAPCGLTGPGTEALAALGLRTVVDLRSENECCRSPVALPRHIRRIWVPLPVGVNEGGVSLVDALLAGSLTEFTVGQLAKLYVSGLEDHAPSFGVILGYLANPGCLPTLVHCSSGKDRTGLVVALVLETLGVHRTEVVDDYALSRSFRGKLMTEMTSALARVGIDRSQVEPLFTAPREALEAALEYVECIYGSVEGYLRERAGVPPDLFERLRYLLLTP